MKFDEQTEKYLKGELFSSAIKVKLADGKSAFIDSISLLKDIASNRKVIHIGAADHTDSIDRKIQKGNWLHQHLIDVSEKCVGIDINQEGIKHLQEKYKIENLYYADVLNDELSFLDGEKWDAVLLPDVLEHVPNVELFLKTVHSKLTDKCELLVATVPNAFCLRNFNNVFFKKIEKNNSDHRYWFSTYTLGKIITESGFKSIEFDYAMRNKLRGSVFENFFKGGLLTKNPCLRDTIVFKCRFS